MPYRVVDMSWLRARRLRLPPLTGREKRILQGAKTARYDASPGKAAGLPAAAAPSWLTQSRIWRAPAWWARRTPESTGTAPTRAP